MKQDRRALLFTTPPKLVFLSLSDLQQSKQNKTQLSGFWDFNLSQLNILIISDLNSVACSQNISLNKMTSSNFKHHVAQSCWSCVCDCGVPESTPHLLMTNKQAPNMGAVNELMIK